MSASQLIADRYRINDPKRDLLGRGGMGEVYRATDTQTGELVAVKALTLARVVCGNHGMRSTTPARTVRE